MLRKIMRIAGRVLIPAVITLLLLEIFLRWALWHGPEALAVFREPSNYASPLSQDYWKLCHYLQVKGARVPANPHPLLGWTYRFHRESYLHESYHEVRDRRPVLLYGDSFSMCVPQAKCFQEFLAEDSLFSAGHYLLNYGVGGYGLGQIKLLFDQTAHRYRHPAVVLGLLTTDIDRSILAARTGQKPWFELENDSLRLRGVPLYPEGERWFEENPLNMGSYTWRFLSNTVFKTSHSEDALKDRIRSLNRRLLETLDRDMRSAGYDYTFLVFHNNAGPGVEEDWRDRFIRSVLDSLNAPYIWSRELIRADYGSTQYDHNRYFIEGDGHPESYTNGLIADSIAGWVASLPGDTLPLDTVTPALYHTMARGWERKIRNNRDWLKRVAEDTLRKGTSMEQEIWNHAVYMILQDAEAHPAKYRYR